MLKLLITLALLVICSLIHSIRECSILFGFLLVCIALLPNKKEFIRRIMLFLPFILATFVVQVFFIPGKIIWTGYSAPLQITIEGLHNGAIVGIRVFLAIGYSIVFVLCTPPGEIAKSLDLLTMNRLKLGESLLVAMKFAELIKKERKGSWGATLKYAIKESCSLIKDQ